MAKKKENTAPIDPNKIFLFSKKNYTWMIVGLLFIFIGFGLMTGPDANTVNGVYDPNKWNENIFSWRRIRLAPIFVIIGFIIEVYAIMTPSVKTSK